jgi:hypothetical protein
MDPHASDNTAKIHRDSHASDTLFGEILKPIINRA